MDFSWGLGVRHSFMGQDVEGSGLSRAFGMSRVQVFVLPGSKVQVTTIATSRARQQVPGLGFLGPHRVVRRQVQVVGLSGEGFMLSGPSSPEA